MAEQVASSILKFKQADGSFLTTFPINTIDEVYVDIDNQIKLRDYLKSKYSGYYEVTNDTARFALKAADVTNGDFVKVLSDDKLYLVTDTTKLNTNAGYELIYAKNADGSGSGGPVNIITYTANDMV